MDLESLLGIAYPMVKLFRGKKRFYVYDAKSSFLTQVTLSDLRELIRMSDNSVNMDYVSTYLHQLRKRGVFLPGLLAKMVPDDDEIQEKVNYSLNNYLPRKFVLEVTEKCNLRCKYCLFSDDTNNRKHTDVFMSQDIAYKAVDYYFDVFTTAFSKVPLESRAKTLKIIAPGISWWGGEPFLNFDLIVKTKAYLETLPWDKYGIDLENIVYSIVTNFTVLNKDIIDFIIKANLFLFVSLDGDKIQHNLNRVYQNGIGSFDTVIANLDFILTSYPEYCKKRLIIQCVLADNTDHTECQKFINSKFSLLSPEKKILKAMYYPQKHSKVFSSKIVKYFTKDDILSSFQYKLNMLNGLKKRELFQMLKADELLLKEFEKLLSFERYLTFNNPKGCNEHAKLFSCPVGIDNIFVSCLGDFHICNKTDNSYSFGNIKDNKLDLAKLCSFYNDYFSGIRSKCISCWAFQFCHICPANLLNKKKFYYPREEECVDIRKNIEITFEKYIMFDTYSRLYNYVTDFILKNKEVSFLDYEGPITINHFNYEENKKD